MLTEFEKSRNRDFKNPSDVTVHDQCGHKIDARPQSDLSSPKFKKSTPSVPIYIKVETQRQKSASMSSRKKSPNVKHFSVQKKK